MAEARCMKCQKQVEIKVTTSKDLKKDDKKEIKMEVKQPSLFDF